MHPQTKPSFAEVLFLFQLRDNEFHSLTTNFTVSILIDDKATLSHMSHDTMLVFVAHPLGKVMFSPVFACSLGVGWGGLSVWRRECQSMSHLKLSPDARSICPSDAVRVPATAEID